jgi:hypothetical protein
MITNLNQEGLRNLIKEVLTRNGGAKLGNKCIYVSMLVATSHS